MSSCGCFGAPPDEALGGAAGACVSTCNSSTVTAIVCPPQLIAESQPVVKTEIGAHIRGEAGWDLGDSPQSKACVRCGRYIGTHRCRQHAQGIKLLGGAEGSAADFETRKGSSCSW